MTPNFFSDAATDGERNASFAALLNSAVIGCGVRAGTTIDYQESTSNSGKPDSVVVGTFGTSSSRIAFAPIARPFTLPDKTCWRIKARR
jgi:hypothetical protein